MIVHAVTFDCWGTILLDSPGSDERYAARRLAGFEAILNAASIPVQRRELDRAYEASGRWLAGTWRRQRDVPVSEHVRALLEAVDPTLPECLSRQQLAALAQAYASPALLAPPAVDAGARGALEWLAARGVTLGVVSNIMRTPGSVLRQILDRSGLLAPLKVLTFSDECGIRKPDPEIFRQTLGQIGVAPEDAVHVGDDPILDVEGARDAGMAVIQVTADGRATAPVKPDAVIRALRELPAALERLASTRARGN
jgi:putative hydrolase of the HAD superfamily